MLIKLRPFWQEGHKEEGSCVKVVYSAEIVLSTNHWKDVRSRLNNWRLSVHGTDAQGENNVLSIADLITSHIIDILAMSESWIATLWFAQVLPEVISPGYEILHVAWPDKRSGGISVHFKEVLWVKSVNHKSWFVYKPWTSGVLGKNRTVSESPSS